MRRYRAEGTEEFESSHAGLYISTDETKKLRKQIKENPNDLKARLLLLGRALWAHSGSPLPHLIWLIDNHPRHFEHSILHLRKDDEVFKEARRHWLRQLRLYPEDVTVICHAASFFSAVRSSESIKLLRRAAILDPDDDDIPRQLSFAYQLKRGKTNAQTKSNLRESVRLMKHAVELYSRPSTDDSYLSSYFGMELGGLANTVLRSGLLEEAEELAALLLNHRRLYAQRLPHYDIDPDARTFDGSKYLGFVLLVAVRQNVSALNRLNIYPRTELYLAVELLENNLHDIAWDYIEPFHRHYQGILENPDLKVTDNERLYSIEMEKYFRKFLKEIRSKPIH